MSRLLRSLIYEPTPPASPLFIQPYRSASSPAGCSSALSRRLAQKARQNVGRNHNRAVSHPPKTAAIEI